MTARGVTFAALAAALLAVAAPPARADGDPASDVLLSQKVFVPYYGKTSKPAAAELKRVVNEAKRKGFTVRVALIGNRYDLGSVAVFWQKPQGYARFLGQELGLTGLYRDRLLVVMPNGYGVSKNGKPLPAELAGLKGVPTAKAGNEDVATAALRAVQRLAAKQGVQVAVTIPKAAPVAKPAASGGGGGNADRVKIVGIALVVLLAIAAVVAARRLRGRRRETV